MHIVYIYNIYIYIIIHECVCMLCMDISYTLTYGYDLLSLEDGATLHLAARVYAKGCYLLIGSETGTDTEAALHRERWRQRKNQRWVVERHNGTERCRHRQRREYA